MILISSPHFMEISTFLHMSEVIQMRQYASLGAPILQNPTNAYHRFVLKYASLLWEACMLVCVNHKDSECGDSGDSWRFGRLFKCVPKLDQLILANEFGWNRQVWYRRRLEKSMVDENFDFHTFRIDFLSSPDLWISPQILSNEETAISKTWKVMGQTPVKIERYRSHLYADGIFWSQSAPHPRFWFFMTP